MMPERSENNPPSAANSSGVVKRIIEAINAKVNMFFIIRGQGSEVRDQ
jgi:hypothetical protein